MNKNDLTLYFNWSSHALIGSNPTMSDRYLRENYSVIKSVADYFLTAINYKPVEIYRGILMQEPSLNKLMPHKNMTYLSFSEDLEIAKSFADVNGFGSQFGINHLLGKYGYVISYTPQLNEVLFHHHFINILPYIKTWNLMGIDGTEKTLEIQKEVTITQPAQPFENITHSKNIKLTIQ